MTETLCECGSAICLHTFHLKRKSFKHMLEKNCPGRIYRVPRKPLHNGISKPTYHRILAESFPPFASPMIQIFVQILHLSTSLCPGYCIFSYDFTIYAVICPRRRKLCCRPVIPSVYSLSPGTLPNRHLRFFYAYQLASFHSSSVCALG